MQFTGLHHLTAITAHASANHAFFTGVLGMRLVKRTVNQDDVSAYHLFYADGLASPGSDITFFDWPAAPERRGTGAIVRTALRVAGAGALDWWARRLDAHGVAHGAPAVRDGRATLDFEDPEGQRLSLVDDGGDGAANPWARSPVPPGHQIRGLGPVTLSVPSLDATAAILTGVMGLRAERRFLHDGAEVHVFAMGAGGAGAELHVAVEPHLPRARQGAGGVHHVAFRTPDIAQYRAWDERLQESGVRSSGPIDRHYFRSLYFREPAGILFEIATDGPGFDTDEPMDSLGERLALPPFLEGRRGEIEAGLKPI